MSYSMAFKNMTKYQLECKVRELESLHKTEIEKLKKEYDVQVESYRKVVEENKTLRSDLAAKEESNKKLAAQFYAYREELVKWKNEAGDWHNKYDGVTVELAGVRGALNRQSELRVNAENKAKELEHLADDLEKQRRELEDWKTGQENNLKEVYRNHDELSNKAWKWDKVHELVNAHGIDTMSKLKDALVELEHKREDVESLKASLADSCSAKIKEGRDLTSKIESLKENLKKMTDSRDWYVKEAAKLRKWYDNLKKLYDKALKEGEEGCTMWREDSWKNRDERDHYKKIYEAAARKNDELQCEVNRLTQDNTALHDRVNILEQRWTDKFNPEDELFGRKISEWQEYDAILVKYGVPSPESLDAKLDPFEPARLTATKSYHVMKNWCVNDEKDLDDELGLLSRYRAVMEKYGIGCPEELDRSLDRRQRMNHMLHELKKEIEQFNQP